MSSVSWTDFRTSLCYPQRRWSVNFWRALIFCSLFSIIFVPEFTRDGNSNLYSPVYAKALGGFRFVDLAILGLMLCHLVALGCMRRRALHFPHCLAVPGAAFLVCVTAAVAYGRARGGNNFFFDWRGLALGIGLFFVWSFWIQNPWDLDAVVRLYAMYMAARIAFLYLLYIAGFRDTLLGVSIPIFDGPALSCIVFTGLLAFTYQDSATGLQKMLWSLLAGAAYLIVLLCFRRTYWGELAVGTGILLLLRSRSRLRSLALIASALGLAAILLGSSFSSRVQSLDVTQTDSEFSAGNSDHLLDLADAWDQVQQAPLMGIGVGTSYRTWRIKGWKTESVMVHNAPLHVWLKYGIAGLFCYLWFHVALLGWLCHRARASPPSTKDFLTATFAYLTAQFGMTLGFAPWPYSELQLTTLISFLIAAAVMCGGQRSPDFVAQSANPIGHHTFL
jgi:O-antigen ligase